MLYLVRHAHAGSKRAWSGPDVLRPLSDQGRLQADALVGMLAPYPLIRLLTSPTERCRQTLEPLAEARKVELADELDLDVDAPAERLHALVGRGGMDGVALCTHGELIGALFDRLVADGADVDGDLRWQKGSVWLLDHVNGSTRATYLPPAPSG